MAGKYDALFTPMEVGGITIKNRIVMPAMSGTAIIESGKGDWHFHEAAGTFLVERAKGGVGLLIPGIAHLTNRFDPGEHWLYECEDTFMGPVKDMMQEIHKYGSKLFLQLGVGLGRTLAIKSAFKPENCDLKKAMQNVPSVAPNVWDPSQTHTPYTVEMIQTIIDAAIRTAVLAQKADIDGIEIHAVHEGYMLDQFSMSCTNQRTDQYGGSLENRLRFTTDIIKGIKAACGEDYPVIVRYSVASKMRGFNAGALPGEDYKEFGRSLEESPAAARILEAAGADALDADNGTYDSWWWAHPPVYMPKACNLPECAYIKHFVKIPVFCAGRMNDPDIAAKAIESGAIDGVGIARQLLADPDWPNKVKEERLADIRPCISCHNGCFGRIFAGKGCSCAINPAAMQEKKYFIEQAAQRKTVLIVGGGIGGMESARVCALRGHDVTLYEKTDELGGVFIAAAAPEFKECDKELIEWYKHELKKCGVKVEKNIEVTPEMLKTCGADEVIIATGAAPRKLELPIADGANVMEAIEYLRGYKQVGETVVVVGGGLTGIEIAYELGAKGKRVSVVEMQDDILKVPGLSAANSNMLREFMRYYEIDVRTSAQLRSIGEQGVVVTKGGAEELLAADSVILSVGYVAQAPLADMLADSTHVHVVGDASHVGNLLDVVWAANDIAMAL